MKHIFIDKIVKIETYKKAKCHLYTVRDVKVSDGFLKYKKEKRVRSLFHTGYTFEEFAVKSPNLYIENDVVYYKPHCDMYLADGSKEAKVFDNPEDLENFVNDLLRSGPSIEYEVI